MHHITQPAKAITLMVQGTTSDAGKSTLVAGLCRCLKQMGYSVAPFKPQNMALNSAVTADGGEIGRAQAVQAQAAGIAPTVDMNPVLLKPSSDTGAQVIIHGKALATMQAQSYHQYKKIAMQAVMSSHQRLTEQYQLIVVEGAGSPAEINLREGDIANMGFAEQINCPVILIADIDKGGVFAHLVGTLELLAPHEQELVAGFVINKFRGDIKLLEPGLKWLEQRTGKPVLGVLPYLHNLQLAAEDAIEASQNLNKAEVRLNIAVPVFKRISNHTDFDMLRVHPQVNLVFVPPGQPIPATDLIILPGSKNVRADLALLKTHGWDQAISRHLRYGGKVLGICGGYQMLGHTITDPLGLEDKPGLSDGLGYLPVDTELRPVKQLRHSRGKLLLHCAYDTAVAIEGYEIHAGVSSYRPDAQPLIQLDSGQVDGCINAEQNVAGCYLHGLFDNPAALQQLLAWAGATTDLVESYSVQQEREIERLAQSCSEHLDWQQLSSLLHIPLHIPNSPHKPNTEKRSSDKSSVAPHTTEHNLSAEKE